MNDLHYQRQRHDMVERQIRARGVTDEKVLAAMRKVPRHLFVEEALREQAYGDFPLPIGEGQTISQPYIVAEMTQALTLSPKDKVLEIGTGSGYQTAILAHIAERVFTIERIQGLLTQARTMFDKLALHNIRARCSDGTLGWPEEAPFDAILVTAGAPLAGKTLLNQLALNGRMVVPVGDRMSQELVKIVRTEKGFSETRMGGCRFVKLIGREGWED
ncbi:MAG: protein-L-isoaspartate(D-aspartate) O-methyltransferase [Desulfatibacillaceae bacterium]|nr:protein-L-isoaspartate(D-aspartate) O-methyltransferase [Desulfatibacillaceae bacterium]